MLNRIFSKSGPKVIPRPRMCKCITAAPPTHWANANATANYVGVHSSAWRNESRPEHESWGYGRSNGPSCWTSLDLNLKHLVSVGQIGRHQSPIDIHTQCTPHETEIMTNIEESNFDLEMSYNVLSKQTTTIHNNGHTIQVYPNEGGGEADEEEVAEEGPEGAVTKRQTKARSFISVYDKKYELAQFHFHTPSEHTEDGVHYPMEMHLVHVCAQDHSIAVVAVFFDTAQHLNNFAVLEQTMDDLKAEKEHENDTENENAFLAQFWSCLPPKEKDIHDAMYAPVSMRVENDIHWLPLLRKAVDGELRGLREAPEEHSQLDIDLFFYEGSLTTPPCTEGVRWMVVKKPQLMSLQQLIAFHRRMHHLHNARPAQAPNDRIVHIATRIEVGLH